MTDDDFNDLIERSSLGTPAARARRASTPSWVAAEILRRAAQLEARSCTSSPVPGAEFELCVQAADELLAQLEEQGDFILPLRMPARLRA